MLPVTERPTAKKSVVVTVLLFGLVPLLNAEILTGSTSIDALLANPILIIVSLPLVLVTYAAPLAILGDLAVRFRFGLRTIFLSGLIYGIINEGVFAKTLVAPYWPGVQFGNFRFLGLNILWLPSILVFHAVVSTTVTILVIRSLWPERVSESFLERKHYIALAAVLAVAIAITNIVFVPLIANNLGYPPPFEPLPFLLLLLLSLFFVLLIKKSLAQKPPVEGSRRRTPAIMYVLLGAGILLLANIANRFALAVAGLWLAVTVTILFGYLFYRYFNAMDSDTEFTKMKTFLVYSTFIIIVLFAGLGGRQPLSNAVAVIGVALELIFGWRASGNPNQ
ncbi:MAG: hypothetical protein KGI38_09470 [Thaumarchaeota archaeon]|nr:hypothetical protein [Nitrososphaerota archaeon]